MSSREPWELLAAKLADTGLTDAAARAWVQEILAGERERIAQAIEASADFWGEPHRHWCIPDLARIARAGGQL